MIIVDIISVERLENDGRDWFEVSWFDGDSTNIDVFGLTNDFVLLDSEGYSRENAWFSSKIKDVLLEYLK